MAFGKVTRINVGMAVIMGLGIYGFVVARSSVAKNRVEIMKSRQRVRDAVEADYEAREAASQKK